MYSCLDAVFLIVQAREEDEYVLMYLSPRFSTFLLTRLAVIPIIIPTTIPNLRGEIGAAEDGEAIRTAEQYPAMSLASRSSSSGFSPSFRDEGLCSSVASQKLAPIFSPQLSIPYIFPRLIYRSL